MLELLSPAGSMEALTAAVQNGANAVYFGLGDFNARKNAKNISEDQLDEAVQYCHLRGVKAYVTMNTLVTDRETQEAAALAARLSSAGVDALIVQDLGLAAVIREIAPDLPIHGSTQMSVHSLDGVKLCAAMGFSRVVVSRELNRQQLAYICKNSPIEIEVFVHGALCMCYSGQCYMSAVIGRRSGNRGLCAQPCRLEYGFGGKADKHPLSLKDNCLASYLQELEEMGVACLKIEGRMKRPEYVAITADVYSRAIASHQTPTNAELARLRAAFSRQGFTDGYYTGSIGPQMFGIREEGSENDTKTLFAAARATYERGQRQCVDVQFAATVQAGEPFGLAVRAGAGKMFIVKGPVPEPAKTKSIDRETIVSLLQRTGGTPYRVTEVRTDIQEGLSLPVSAINAARREALDALSSYRMLAPQRRALPYTQGYKSVNRREAPGLTVYLDDARQLSGALLKENPLLIYLPVSQVSKYPAIVQPIAEAGIPLCPVLPRICPDNEVAEIEKMLEACRLLGIDQIMVSNLGQIPLARRLGFKFRCDFGLNVFNSGSLEVLEKLEAQSATLSFELSLSQIRDISKNIDTEIIAYGRLPLMVTENCVFKNKDGKCRCSQETGLTDRTGAVFPLAKDGNSCRTVILNSQDLYLGDKQEECSRLGLWALRLMFHKETAAEIPEIIQKFKAGTPMDTGTFTRGLYFRGVM